MLTFICNPKCTTCQKAKTLLDSYNAQYETRNIKTDNPSYDELRIWLTLSGLPVKSFFNTRGQLYKSLGLKDKLPSMSEDECLKLLAMDGMLVKRPLLVDEYRALVGFDSGEWMSVFTEYDRKKLDKIFNEFFDEMYELVKAREETEEGPRKTRVVNTSTGKVAITNYDVQIFVDAEMVLSFAVTTEQAYDCRNIAVRKEMFTEDFFDLSSGLVSEIAHKLDNNDFRLAIIGDFSGYSSKPIKDFIDESNMGRHLVFVADENEAIKRLSE